MILTLDIVSLVLAGLLGMAVGGNNLSACCGPLMGSGMVSRRTGILIAIAGYILGLALEGPKLFRVREIFLPIDTATGTFSILLASLIVFLGGELSQIPLSLSKALTGAVLGRGALRRLTEGIFSLRYPNAFFSQLIGSATVELANQLGVPLSITETVSSGIIGSGLARRMRMMNARNVFLIISSWIISPIAGFLLAFTLTKLL